MYPRIDAQLADRRASFLRCYDSARKAYRIAQAGQ